MGFVIADYAGFNDGYTAVQDSLVGQTKLELHQEATKCEKSGIRHSRQLKQLLSFSRRPIYRHSISSGGGVVLGGLLVSFAGMINDKSRISSLFRLLFSIVLSSILPSALIELQ